MSCSPPNSPAALASSSILLTGCGPSARMSARKSFTLLFGGARLQIAVSGKGFVGSYRDVLALEHDGRAYDALRNDVLLKAERQSLLRRGQIILCENISEQLHFRESNHTAYAAFDVL